MGTARVKQEEVADTRIIAKKQRETEKRNIGMEGISLNQGLSSAEDLTVMLPERRYHRLK